MAETFNYRVREKLKTLDKECYIYKSLSFIREESKS